MKLYAVVQKKELTGEPMRILGVTKYPKDAKVFAAEQNDYERSKYDAPYFTTLDGYELCEVIEFESENINTKIDVSPLILYRFIYDLDGSLRDNWDDGYTLKEYTDIHYDEEHRDGELVPIIYAQMTFESSIPGSAILGIAQDRIDKFIKEHYESK